MNKHKNEPITNKIAYAIICLCFILLFSLSWSFSARDNTESATSKLEKSITRKFAKLDKISLRILNSDLKSNSKEKTLPKDMIIYKYVNDSLVYWNNQFQIINDDISRHYVLPALINPRLNLISPLSDITEDLRFMDLGTSFYLVKSTSDGHDTVIEGLDISKVCSDESSISIKSLSWPGGTAVNLDGKPVFKLVKERIGEHSSMDPSNLMPLLIMLVTSILLLLVSHRSIKWLVYSVISLMTCITALYFWGRSRQFSSGFFSPTIYADGNFLYSLGAVILINLAITLCVTCIYILRRPVLIWLTELRNSWKKLSALTIIAAIGGIFIYVYHTFRSIVLNSSICLEIYKINELSLFSLIIYASFCLLILTVPLLIQLLRPLAKELFNSRLSLFSIRFRVVFSLLCATFLVVISAVSGFEKEQASQELWAYRLSMERDVRMEMHLRSVEKAIAGDRFLGALASLNNTESTIASRIDEYYFSKEAQDYNMKVHVINDENRKSSTASYMEARMNESIAIDEGSYFRYSNTSNATVTYCGYFNYFNYNSGISSIMLEITPKNNLQDKGYANILALSIPGRVSVPQKYSYARYDGEELSYFKGNYAYPTSLTDEYKENFKQSVSGHFKDRNFTHFITNVSDDTVIIISRQTTGGFEFVFSVLFLALGLFTFISIFIIGRNQKKAKLGNNYYRSTASTILIASLVGTLVVMACVSIIFVYKRNESNMQTSLSEKISTIQNLFAEECSQCKSITELESAEFLSLMRMVSDMAKTDITLYSTDGKVFRSTIPEVFDRTLVGSRISQKALNGIIRKNQRYCILHENLGSHRYFALYAPLFNSHGNMIAIISAPYSEPEYDFRTEAVVHLIAIMIVFVILLLIAHIAIESVIDHLFKPLVEMGKKMGATDVDNLECIEYGREDEVSTLVNAYNRMVHDLSESTQRLAQAERDRAWSDMARQVAHEIKNPLTPMKLQIQRLIRLKDKNDPAWQDKFDECTKVVLDHIDILSDTANEFSTFAKLYSEEPALIDLNKLIEEEVRMFDNKEYLEIVYAGLSNAMIMGPKPQLTRVVVNLITNSIQAIDIARDECEEKGLTPDNGKIFISVRNSSTSEDCFDIVFEDNGPGVSKENMEKLFTPNFTTKNSGTGLGLAICKNILEKCSARISYSRSFTLDGACFTIVYPKYSEKDLTSDGYKAE